ncbi:hypothetical protein GGR28_001050 [Lewinella aquimaris]|uniref:Uncharacterized protein n=1 Tax=Neolewinella aquimaris TaxID=1835722 RepID=A0A840E5J9_9BACT|nr:hypothetical protein [Neolewinella aquimaris]MBB4078437.1 hypothetical protein [Neolewinella aquimaris]
MPRTRLTGFSRLIIFLIIALPIVYVGAALYNGEDPVRNVKGWLGIQDPEPREEMNVPPSSAREAPATFESVQELRDENERLRQELARCQGISES